MPHKSHYARTYKTDHLACPAGQACAKRRVPADYGTRVRAPVILSLGEDGRGSHPAGPVGRAATIPCLEASVAWWLPRSSKPVRVEALPWRVRFPSASAELRFHLVAVSDCPMVPCLLARSLARF